MNTTSILNKLISQQNLTAEETELFLHQVIKGLATPAQIGAILVALRMKGETSAEIVGFIKAMRQHMIHVNAKNALDVCGTGGDHSGTFNISTAVAFVVAGTGVKVAKHGNRAASSRCGSADVLEALSVNLQLTPSQAKKVLGQVGMVFLFAPLYHPAMKQVALVRQELGVRTIFNILGPFTNPAGVKRQLVGVPDIPTAKKLAQAARHLSYTRLIIVTSNGLDEVSLSTPTTAFVVEGQKITKMIINPAQYGFPKPKATALKGGDATLNAAIIHQVLAGKPGPQKDIVVLNSAVALYAAGQVANLATGITQAKEAIDSGRAQKVLKQLVKATQTYA